MQPLVPLICHPYIPLHLEEMTCFTDFGCANAPSTICIIYTCNYYFLLHYRPSLLIPPFPQHVGIELGPHRYDATLLTSTLCYTRSVSSTQHIYSFTGYNYIHGYTHYRHYYFEEFHAAFIIRCLRSTYGIHSPCENIVQFVSCS